MKIYYLMWLQLVDNNFTVTENKYSSENGTQLGQLPYTPMIKAGKKSSDMRQKGIQVNFQLEKKLSMLKELTSAWYVLNSLDEYTQSKT